MKAMELNFIQKEILREIKNLKSNKEIAKTMSFSQNSIKCHIFRIFKFFGVRSRKELFLKAPYVHFLEKLNELTPEQTKIVNYIMSGLSTNYIIENSSLKNKNHFGREMAKIYDKLNLKRHKIYHLINFLRGGKK